MALVQIDSIVLNTDNVLKYRLDTDRVDVELPGPDNGYLNVVSFSGTDAAALKRWLENHSVNLTAETEDAQQFTSYREAGGDMLFSEWRRINNLHKQYMHKDEISPYEEKLLL